MTLQEILRAKGIADADIESIISEMKVNKIYTTIHENMDVRYPKLKGDYDNLNTRHNELLTNNQDVGVLQGKITEYETTIANLSKQVEDQKIDSAMDRKLTSAGAKPEDFDYLKFQWRKKGEINLDDNGEVKGGDDVINGLKTQHPAQFATTGNQREIEPHKLHDRNNNGDDTITKEEFNKMGYNARVKLKEENPELYSQLTKG